LRKGLAMITSQPIEQPGKPALFRRSLIVVVMSTCLAGVSVHARAQNPLTVTAPVSGRTIDGQLSFSGTASVNTLTRRGTIRGRTNTGSACEGTTTANLTFSMGEGSIVCGRISARFAFSLSRRQPPTGTGTGTLSDGRKVLVRIGE
jgi:hypothetical protein